MDMNRPHRQVARLSFYLSPGQILVSDGPLSDSAADIKTVWSAYTGTTKAKKRPIQWQDIQRAPKDLAKKSIASLLVVYRR